MRCFRKSYLAPFFFFAVVLLLLQPRSATRGPRGDPSPAPAEAACLLQAKKNFSLAGDGGGRTVASRKASVSEEPTTIRQEKLEVVQKRLQSSERRAIGSLASRAAVTKLDLRRPASAVGLASLHSPSASAWARVVADHHTGASPVDAYYFWCGHPAVAGEGADAVPLPIDGGEPITGWCMFGVTRFGWACLLTAASMCTIVGCVPFLLIISRRRPPGEPMLPCPCCGDDCSTVTGPMAHPPAQRLPPPEQTWRKAGGSFSSAAGSAKLSGGGVR